MKQIAAAKFKAQCLHLMDEVKTSREPLLIRKKGRPVAMLVPADEPPKDVFGCLAGTLEITGDVLSPVVPAREWNALR
ncbi:MAG TPA: type II toxin-antitoxin system Phd/YefM family antitoxin [Thermoanaerobaculia bacterium]|nr:type II toxin-antitoxin system Phd/YefM family antitoxin [Thermoanaerobaculia bacterium]HQR66055.1 type II toxin-antitoxin system Phd/YefM family antitoxin [Thermoanaerobaculia bacterium]